MPMSSKRILPRIDPVCLDEMFNALVDVDCLKETNKLLVNALGFPA